MMCQIEAEELMQEEIDLDGDKHIVAEAEQLYRDATIEVKQLIQLKFGVTYSMDQVRRILHSFDMFFYK